MAEAPSEDRRDMAGKADSGGARKNKCLVTTVAILLGGILIILILSIVLIRVFCSTASTPQVAPPISATTLPCPPGWMHAKHQNGEKCYYFSDTEANWNVSQMNCSSLGGSLVIMETKEEMEFILRSKSHLYIWIGLWREDEGKQVWKTPNGTIFRNWYPIHGQGWCAYLNEEKVQSTFCTNYRFYICSKPALVAEGTR